MRSAGRINIHLVPKQSLPVEMTIQLVLLGFSLPLSGRIIAVTTVYRKSPMLDMAFCYCSMGL